METAVKENGILFQAPMVRAILEGNKTQTRRIADRVKGFGKIRQFGESNTPGYDFHFRCRRGLWQDFRKQELIDRCPYGKAGERLWVRETHYVERAGYQDGTDRFILYKATDDHAPVSKWTPSIHMPRFASRINLEIVRVGVERLQDISFNDAIAEGILQTSDESMTNRTWRDYSGLGVSSTMSPFSSYRTLWESINGPASWDQNPWVWVIEFKKTSP